MDRDRVNIVIINDSRHPDVNDDAIITGSWISGVIHDDIDIIRLSHLPSTFSPRPSSTPSIVYDDKSTCAHLWTFDLRRRSRDRNRYLNVPLSASDVHPIIVMIVDEYPFTYIIVVGPRRTQDS